MVHRMIEGRFCAVMPLTWWMHFSMRVGKRAGPFASFILYDGRSSFGASFKASILYDIIGLQSFHLYGKDGKMVCHTY